MMATILGFMPDVKSCSLCGRSEGGFYFDIMGGNVICTDCKISMEKSNTEINDPHESSIISILTPTARMGLFYFFHKEVGIRMD